MKHLQKNKYLTCFDKKFKSIEKYNREIGRLLPMRLLCRNKTIKKHSKPKNFINFVLNKYLDTKNEIQKLGNE